MQATGPWNGSWSHHRQANHCWVDFIESDMPKIVDVAFAELLIGFFTGNYNGPFNGMKVEGLRRFFRRPVGDQRIVG
jgi:hypothetical protein